jgi:hypothetical protein
MGILYFLYPVTVFSNVESQIISIFLYNISSPVDLSKVLGSLHFGAIMNTAAVDSQMQVLFGHIWVNT